MAKDSKTAEELATPPAPSAPSKSTKADLAGPAAVAPPAADAAPPVKPARFRMHPYGGLDYDGEHYPAGEELPLTEDEIKTLGLEHCVVRIPD